MTTQPTLEVLLPAGTPPLEPDDAETRLAELHAEPRLPWVRANMVATLDGAATGADGRSGSINGEADARVFHLLRALADVVVVGAGTVRAEGYRAPRTPDRFLPGRRARGQADHPALAIVTAHGDVPDVVLRDEPGPWVFTVGDAPHLDRLREHVPPRRLVVHDGAVDLERLVTTLAAAGLPRLLSEGGPTLLGDLLAAGVVDELCLTWSPTIVGGRAGRVVSHAGWLTPPPAARPAHLLHRDGVLLGRWLLKDAGHAH